MLTAYTFLANACGRAGEGMLGKYRILQVEGADPKVSSAADPPACQSTWLFG